MRIRHTLAALAAWAVASVGAVAAPPAAQAAVPVPQASSWGCSKWITTYSGFLGVTIYRGHLVCYGDIPGKEYRSHIVCTLHGEYWNRAFGGWKKQGSGKESYNSCPWPSRIEKLSNIKTETR